MKFVLNQIKKNTYNEPFIFDKVVDVSELESMDNDIREIKPVRVQGVCTIEGEQILFSLTISGEMILPCARTLVDVPYSFEVNETEIFSTSTYYGQEEIDNEIYPIQGEVIDLTPCLQENISLAIPFRVFSSDDQAKKQALQQGDGWTLSLESDHEEKQGKTIDPRLEKLRSLLKDSE